jgi:hypothetical protein
LPPDNPNAVMAVRTIAATLGHRRSRPFADGASVSRSR